MITARSGKSHALITYTNDLDDKEIMFSLPLVNNSPDSTFFDIDITSYAPCTSDVFTVYCYTSILCTDTATVATITDGSSTYLRVSGLLKAYTPASSRVEFSIVPTDCDTLKPASFGDVKTVSIASKWPYSTDGSPTYNIDKFDNIQYTRPTVAGI